MTSSAYTLQALADLQSAKWGTTTYTWTAQAGASFTLTAGGSADIESAHRVAKQHECPHCFRQRHPEPLTQRQARMYDDHRFDSTYDAATDDSGVVCIGADYYGPAIAEGPRSSSYWPTTSPVTGWIISDALWQSFTVPNSGSFAKLWTADFQPFFPVGPEKTECEEIPVTYNDPENWKPWEDCGPLPDLGVDVELDGWLTTFPKPQAPGYDFSSYKYPEVKYPNRKKKNETF